MPEEKKPDEKKIDEEIDEEPNVEEKGTRRIKVDVTMTKEMKELQDRLRDAENKLTNLTAKSTTEKEELLTAKEKLEQDLKEKTAILEQQALDDFEKEKKALLDMASKSKLSKEQVEEIEKKLSTPKNLEIVKGIMEMMVAAIPSPEEDKDKKETKEKKTVLPPTGKAPFALPANAETFKDNVEMIDELYNRAYYHKDKYTPEQIADAKRKIDTIFQSLITGPSWDSLRKREKMSLPKIMACPKCGMTIIGEPPDKCEKCGFSLGKTGDVLRGRG